MLLVPLDLRVTPQPFARVGATVGACVMRFPRCAGWFLAPGLRGAVGVVRGRSLPVLPWQLAALWMAALRLMCRRRRPPLPLQ